jgi:glutathione S-transferase
MEELGLPYELKSYPRDPQTMRAHPVFAELNPVGQAPVIQDGDVTMAESGAILTYILEKYGDGKLRIAPGAPNYADYVYWFHYANGSFAPLAIQNLASIRMPDGDAQRAAMTRAYFGRHLAFIDRRLADNDYLAGPAFTAADIMPHFWFGAASRFAQIDLNAYPNIRRWLARIIERPAYRRAMKQAGHDKDPALQGA